MRNSRGAFFTLAVLGGYVAWQNRFAIQRSLESIGIKTPFLTGDVGETTKSAISKASGKLEHASNQVDNQMRRKFGT